MAFQPGVSGNPAGRPVGAKTRVEVPVRTKKQLLKAMEQRALTGDVEAQNKLFDLAFRTGSPAVTNGDA